MKIEKIIPDNQQDSAEDHFSSNVNTPLRDDAFLKTDEEKIVIIVFNTVLNKTVV